MQSPRTESPPDEATGNSVAEEQLNRLLETIVVQPAQHVRWLNTLALLEFMGTRKIARSLAQRRADRTALQHLAEEARHAYFFKRSIERIQPDADPGFAASETLAGFSAARYFHRLDSFVSRDLTRYFAQTHPDSQSSSAVSTRANSAVQTELCYLYVTTLIEERAGWLYPAYDAVLAAREIPIRLGGVILEEEQHLADMYAVVRELDSDCEARLAGYRRFEAEAFANFFTRLNAAVEVASYSASTR